MIGIRVPLLMLVLYAGMSAAAPPKDAADPTANQRQLIIVEGQFQWVEGSWARYDVTDKAKKENYKLTFAVLERKDIKRKPYRWMELEATLEKEPKVITRFLAEETAEGPGKLEEVIVQMEGLKAFRVPRKYLNPEKGKSANPVVPAAVLKRLAERKVVVAGKQVNVIEVEAEDGKGRPLTATVSLEVAPIGVVEAENGEVVMKLADFGGGAATRVNGPVLNFYLWIMERLAGAL